MPGTIAFVMPRKKYGESSFGERLQSIRKARGLTQVQLAEAAGTTQRAISYYETEAGFPPAPAVIDLAEALSITTDELLGVKPPRIERMNDDSGEDYLYPKDWFALITVPDAVEASLLRTA
jgi:transcriptional regulator with XRE-family HTH domain